MTGLAPEDAAVLARQHGLREVGVRPPLWEYLRETWRRRGFIWTLASARSSAQHQNNYLGWLWSIINPAFLVATYFLIFGLMLDTRRGVSNFIGYLTVGIFLFAFTSSSLTKGARAITGNAGLVRALQFPRCVLPLAVVATEFVSSLPAFGLLIVVMLATGERPSLGWVLYPAALAINLSINAGLALIVARIVNSARDLANMVSVVVRLLRYVSGVFFSISHFVGSGAAGTILGYQPTAVSLTIARQALMHEDHVNIKTWAVAGGWAVLVPVVGMIVFWRAEETYGRG